MSETDDDEGRKVATSLVHCFYDVLSQSKRNSTHLLRCLRILVSVQHELRGRTSCKDRAQQPDHSAKGGALHNDAKQTSLLAVGLTEMSCKSTWARSRHLLVAVCPPSRDAVAFSSLVSDRPKVPAFHRDCRPSPIVIQSGEHFQTDLRGARVMDGRLPSLAPTQCCLHHCRTSNVIRGQRPRFPVRRTFKRMR